MCISTPFVIVAEVGTSEGWGIKLLVGLVGGVVATFLGFLLNQRYQNDKEKIKDFKEYIVALQSTANELEFYTAKLKQLSSELQAVVETLQALKTEYIIPTYSLYPGFLENCKTTISSFHKNPKVVKGIGHCHFELCHILERLTLFKREATVPLPQDPRAVPERLAVQRFNTLGFKGLVDSNIPIFEAAREEILSEKAKMENELRLQKERSLVAISD